MIKITNLKLFAISYIISTHVLDEIGNTLVLAYKEAFKIFMEIGAH